MTEVVYAEAKCIVVRKGGAERWAQIAAEPTPLPIEFHPATRPLEDLAAEFKARYKLSLAAALAKERKAQVVTGDPEFRALEKEVRIGWLG